MTNRSKGAQNYLKSVSKVYQNQIKTTRLLNVSIHDAHYDSQYFHKFDPFKTPDFCARKIFFTRCVNTRLTQVKPTNQLQKNSTYVLQLTDDQKSPRPFCHAIALA